MSSELKSFLHTKGVPTSRSTPYHPSGNGQCERFVGTIWKTITLCLESRNLPINAWESVLPDALHSLRSLLCTATNCTPHERMFLYSRKSVSGTCLPTWLTTPGTVLLRKHVRNKDDPLVEEVELLESNPLYAHIKYPNGKEDTVAIKDLALSGVSNHSDATNSDNSHADTPEVAENLTFNAPSSTSSTMGNQTLRRSDRIRKAPNRYGYT